MSACEAVRCGVLLKPGKLMCARHWSKVPKEVRRLVDGHFRFGQDHDKSPSAEWLVARARAVGSVGVQEGTLSRRMAYALVANEVARAQDRGVDVWPETWGLRPTRLQVLAIRQPWAWLIMEGHKQIENRTLYPPCFLTALRAMAPFRPFFIAVHASATPDRDAALVLEGLRREGIDVPLVADMERGAVLGLVEVVNAEPYEELVEATRSDALTETLQDRRLRFARPESICWSLARPWKFREPIPHKGSLSLRDAPLSIVHPGRDLYRRQLGLGPDRETPF